MRQGISEDDRRELAQCFVLNAAELFGYACWLTRGDRQLAQDLVQDAFHEATARWQDLRDWSTERKGRWLRGTVHNLAVTCFRHAVLARDKQEVIWERYRPPDTDVYEEALTDIALQRCWRVIRQMPPREHLVAVLRWSQDMSIGEIAGTLGMAEGTVCAHLASARKKLIAEAGPHLPFDLGSGPREGGSRDE